MTIRPVPASQAVVRCDPASLPFESTSELKETLQIVGQERALEAVEFGIGIEHRSFNLFVVGPQGTGRHTVIRSFIDQKAMTSAAPSDWCYVHNFRQQHKPLALEFPNGKALVFKKEMGDLVEMLKVTLSTVFESEGFKAQMRAVQEELKRKVDRIYRQIEEKAKRESIAVVKSEQGIMVAPMDGEGNILDTEQFLKLPAATRQKIDELIEKYQLELQEGMHQITQVKRETEALKVNLKRQTASQAVTSLTNTLKMKYRARADLSTYLQDVEDDIVEHSDDFLHHAEDAREHFMSMMAGYTPSFDRYEVNILVGNDSNSAPVVYEDLPTYQNLHGRIENLARMGMLSTHFTLIKPGSLHMANGGYIIIDARRLLMQPYAYEGLKRTLRSGQIRIESLERLLGLMNTVSLEPQPIPLRAKVVLIGESYLYYLLKFYDPEFDSLFKVQVDFEHTMDRNELNMDQYVALIAGMLENEKLLPMDRTAVARIIEHSSRLSGDGEKLSLYLEELLTIIQEADHLARKRNSGIIVSEDVQAALDASKRRSGRIRDRMFEAIEKGIRHIETSGEKIGQINGLSVISLGSSYFGVPTRITALTRPGSDSEVIDIEKQVELGGPIHSKGVLILESFLRSRYLRNMPIGMRASLVFEQSYGGVEGDSASCAELCALLSSLAGAPIKQGIAITGSVSQQGEVQAIGGVNEKIEGFFDLCSGRGLTGEQGVIIPASNTAHLMLKEEVVAAIEAGKFTIWSVECVDDAIEVLTGIQAGTRLPRGSYPFNSINARVETALKKFVLDLKNFEEPKKKES